MKALLLILFFCLFSPVWANSPVWMVENGNNRLYLAGTIHVLRSSDYPLPEALNQAYIEAEILTFETDIDSSMDPAFVRLMAESMRLPADTQLNELLNQHTLSALKKYLQSNNLNFSQFARFKPAMIAMTLTFHELKKIGAGSYGVDQHFFSRAQNDSKTTAAFETSQQQLQFLSTMGEGQEDLIIMQTLEDIKTLQSQFEEMIKSWRSGDQQQLEELFILPMKEKFNPLYQQLLVQRNNNWMPEIIRYLQTPETEMILVGAAHLLGADGLINQLRQAGYKISPLN